MSKIWRIHLGNCGRWKKYKNCFLTKVRNKKNIKSDNNEEYDINKMNNLIANNPSNVDIKKILKLKNSIKFLDKLGILNFFMKDSNVEEIRKSIASIEELGDINGIINAPDKFNAHFEEMGWIAYENMDFQMMQKAIEIAEKEDLESAETYLVNEYSKRLDQSLENFYHFPDELNNRKYLIELAFNDYKEERYYSCILLLFTIIDGFVADCNMTEGEGFFTNNSNIYAWDSIAAHITGLDKLKNLFYQNRGNTNNDEISIPYRNGIMHGRDLNYNNKIVATKLWAALFALKDGILAMKRNGKTPPKEEESMSFKELIEFSLKEKEYNELLNKELDQFNPRNMIFDKSQDTSQNIDDYKPETPEYSLVQFFNFWKKENFGRIAEMRYKTRYDEFNLKKEAGIMRREIFVDKKLISFRILSISEDTISTANISTELQININGINKTESIDFRLIYSSKDEHENPLRAIPSLHNGVWKILNYSQIKNIE